MFESFPANTGGERPCAPRGPVCGKNSQHVRFLRRDTDMNSASESLMKDFRAHSHTHTHTHTFESPSRKAEKHAEKEGWPDRRQACNSVRTKNKLRQARRTCSPLQPAARTGETAARRSRGRPSACRADPEENMKMDDQPENGNYEQHTHTLASP